MPQRGPIRARKSVGSRVASLPNPTNLDREKYSYIRRVSLDRRSICRYLVVLTAGAAFNATDVPFQSRGVHSWGPLPTPCDVWMGGAMYG